MKPYNDYLASFPKIPEHQYVSYPIYLEAIQGSGERITVIIAITSPEIVIHKVIREETINAMYGSKSASFIGMIELCANSLESHLTDGNSFASWKPPVSGLYKGNENREHAHGSTDHLRLSTRIYSSMGFIPSQADFEEAISPAKKDRWLDLVRNEIMKESPSLVENFTRSFNVSRNTRPTAIDYIGTQYAANLCKLDPGQNFTNHIRMTKAKLWDMEALRDSRHGMFIDKVKSFDVIVWRPANDSPAYSQRQIDSLKQALAELEYEGNKRDLLVIPVENKKEAACRIIEKEAA